MSTILDALRRLQRERSRDLHDSVALDPGPGSGRRLPWLTLLLLLLLAAGAGAAWTIWPGRDAFVESWQALLGPEAAPRPEPAAGPAPAPESTVAARAEASPPPAPVVRPRSALTPQDLEARRQAAREAARQRAERVARGRVPPPPPEPAPRASASAASAAPDAAAFPPSGDSYLNAPSEPPRPRVDVGLVLEPEPRPRAGGSRERDEYDLIADPTREPTFPDLSVQQVRWHPDPERREARILLDEMRPFVAHEGDIISGVVVHRIDPGEVEFRVGDMGIVIGP